MTAPLEIQFRGVAASATLESMVRERSHRLGAAFAGAAAETASCRVLIQQMHMPARVGEPLSRDPSPSTPSHKHPPALGAAARRDWPFVVRVDLAWPGHQLAVSRVHNEDPGRAASEAFSAMKRRLEGVARREREGP